MKNIFAWLANYFENLGLKKVPRALDAAATTDWKSNIYDYAQARKVIEENDDLRLHRSVRNTQAMLFFWGARRYMNEHNWGIPMRMLALTFLYEWATLSVMGEALGIAYSDQVMSRLNFHELDLENMEPEDAAKLKEFLEHSDQLFGTPPNKEELLRRLAQHDSGEPRH